MKVSHFLDRDACCIHCGLDACDVPMGEPMPSCTVWDETKRAENTAAWSKERDEWFDNLPDLHY